MKTSWPRCGTASSSALSTRPMESHTSRVRGTMPMALAWGCGAASRSTMRQSTPCRRSSAAAVRPTGPAPTTSTSTSATVRLPRCPVFPRHRVSPDCADPNGLRFRRGAEPEESKPVLYQLFTDHIAWIILQVKSGESRRSPQSDSGAPDATNAAYHRIRCTCLRIRFHPDPDGTPDSGAALTHAGNDFGLAIFGSALDVGDRMRKAFFAAYPGPRKGVSRMCGSSIRFRYSRKVWISRERARPGRPPRGIVAGLYALGEAAPRRFTVRV